LAQTFLVVVVELFVFVSFTSKNEEEFNERGEVFFGERLVRVVVVEEMVVVLIWNVIGDKKISIIELS
jgi:hypothetical protein